MFERRLKVLLGLLGIALLCIVARLGQLQIVQAEYYRKRAEQSLTLRPRQIPFVRGSILDRTGEVLVRDEPCWGLAVDYSVIVADVGDQRDQAAAIKRHIKRWKRARRHADATTDEEIEYALRDEVAATWVVLVRRYPKATTDQEIEQAFRDEVATMWGDMAEFSTSLRSSPAEEPRLHARDIYDQVARIRRVVKDYRGFDAPVAEETIAHVVVGGLDSVEQIDARELARRYPWVHVKPASTRKFKGSAKPFAHLLGRLGRVDATHVANDPNADDPFAKYRADERVGISGVEHAAEQILRGRRGQVSQDRQGNVVEERCIEAEDGKDVTLTIHADLQRRLYRTLGQAVEAIPESSGGVIVVLDVISREALVLVSYPSYDPNRFVELYPALRDDTNRLPLLFRAVSSHYAPGSTVKPLTCLAGLMNGTITLDTRQVCTGYMFDDVRDRWRCWKIHGTNQRKAHGSVDVVEALTGSCNVFMYRLGEMLGTDGLCSVFDMVGIGKKTRIGLREEVKGINPTPSWLMAHKNIRATPGTARLFAIGQGELSMTPLQVANVMATYANGRYRPVTLIRSETPTPEWIIPAKPDHWAAIRRGIYGVVNDPEGTAYKYAHFEHDRWALCGKTGSASAHPWPTSYRIPYVDKDEAERVALVRTGTRRAAIERFVTGHPQAVFDPTKVEVATRWPRHPPPPGEKFSHAWFDGYLQAQDAAGRPDWSRTPRLAFAVLVEFGGSGGRTAGPLAKAVVAELLNVFGPALDIDAYAVGQARR